MVVYGLNTTKPHQRQMKNPVRAGQDGRCKRILLAGFIRLSPPEMSACSILHRLSLGLGPIRWPFGRAHQATSPQKASSNSRVTSPVPIAGSPPTGGATSISSRLRSSLTTGICSFNDRARQGVCSLEKHCFDVFRGVPGGSRRATGVPGHERSPVKLA